MKIDEQKQKMLNYTDFFGGTFLEHDKIKSAKTKAQLKEIIDNHHDFLESQCNDAQSSLERFSKSIKLSSLSD